MSRNYNDFRSVRPKALVTRINDFMSNPAATHYRIGLGPHPSKQIGEIIRELYLHHTKVVITLDTANGEARGECVIHKPAHYEIAHPKVIEPPPF